MLSRAISGTLRAKCAVCSTFAICSDRDSSSSSGVGLKPDFWKEHLRSRCSCQEARWLQSHSGGLFLVIFADEYFQSPLASFWKVPLKLNDQYTLWILDRKANNWAFWKRRQIYFDPLTASKRNSFSQKEFFLSRESSSSRLQVAARVDSVATRELGTFCFFAGKALQQQKFRDFSAFKTSLLLNFKKSQSLIGRHSTLQEFHDFKSNFS